VAHLARIDLTSNELEKLSRQLQDILSFIDKLSEVDIKEIKPTSHILALNNVLRQDTSKTSLTLEQALANAPRKEGSSFAVPKVIE